MKKMISVLACMLALVFCLTACGQAAITPVEGLSLAKGGILYLTVNPEIEVAYDNNGNVTGVTAKNDDALKILANYSGFEGKAAKTVVSELVTAIGEAGYFVEEIEGERRQITLEIEPGSVLPNDKFLDELIASVKNVVEQHQWTTPLNLEGITDYGMTDYVDTDYGPNADGVTDYDDTDYGPNADGVTDYNDSPYGESPYDGSTDYDDGSTDYDADSAYDR